MAEKIVIAELQLNVKSLIENSAETLKMLNSLKEQNRELSKETGNLTNATEKQSQQYVKTAADIKNLSQSYNANLKILADTNQEIADQEANVKLLNLALETEVSSINEARDQNKLLTKIRNELNVSTDEGQIQLSLLNNKINENNDFVKENGDALLKQKMNIGNYADGMKEALSQINPFNGGLSGFIERSKEAGGAGNLFKTSLSGITTGLGGVIKASLTFIATPIGAVLAAIVLVFALVKNAMDRSEESTNKITRVFSAFGGITNKLLGFLEPLGEFLIDGIVAGFELAGKAAEGALNIISGGLSMLGFDDAAKEVTGFKDSMKGAVQGAQALADAEAKLEKQQRLSQKIQLDYQKDAEKLRQVRDDESKTIQERIAANTELGNVLKRQLADELKIAQLALLVANERIKAEGKTSENLDKQAEALTTISDIQERLSGQESEQLANLNSLRKESADKQKELIDKAIQKRKEQQDREIQSMNEELSLFVAKENLKSKTVEQSIDFEESISKKRIEILDKEYAYGKKSKLQYEEELIAITQESTLKQAELIFNRSKAELDLFISQNVRKLDSAKLLTQDLVDEETKRLESIKLDKINLIEQEKKTNQTIIDEKIAANKQLSLADIEFLTNKNNIEADFRNQNKANQDAFNEQEKQQKAEQLIADREIELANAATKREEDNLITQEQYDVEIAMLEEKLLKEFLTKEQFDAKVIQADDKKKKMMKLAEINDTQSKLGEYQKLGQGLQNLFGKNKLIASALAGVNTSLGVTEILKTPSVLPEPMASISRGVQIGTTIATGVKSIAEINGVKFEKGGLQKIGGNRHSSGGTKFVGEDGTRFEAEQGELIGVMNRNASRAFMEFNNAYPSGSGSTSSNVFADGGFVTQQSITNSSSFEMNYDLLASKLAQANSQIPPPVVYAAVTDMNYGQQNYAQVVSGANH